VANGDEEAGQRTIPRVRGHRCFHAHALYGVLAQTSSAGVEQQHLNLGVVEHAPLHDFEVSSAFAHNHLVAHVGQVRGSAVRRPPRWPPFR
jgi:hypothetical protein